LDSVPFVVDSKTNLRTGGYGMVEKVFEGNIPLARKTIRDNYDLEKIMMEIKILELATETENPHLLHLRCDYQQSNIIYLVMSPWCDLDLSTFLKSADRIQFWA
jgi:hypothetical protein